MAVTVAGGTAVVRRFSPPNLTATGEMLRGRIVFYAIVLLLRMPAVIPARNYEQQQ